MNSDPNEAKFHDPDPSSMYFDPQHRYRTKLLYWILVLKK